MSLITLLMLFTSFLPKNQSSITIEISLKMRNDGYVKIYYDNTRKKNRHGFHEENSQTYYLSGNDNYQKKVFKIEFSGELYNLRFDFSSQQENFVIVKYIKMNDLIVKDHLFIDFFKPSNGTNLIHNNDQSVTVSSETNKKIVPHITINISKFVLLYYHLGYFKVPPYLVRLELLFKAKRSDELQVFYLTSESPTALEQFSYKIVFDTLWQRKIINYYIPSRIRKIKIDLGYKGENEVIINKIKLRSEDFDYSWNGEDIISFFENNQYVKEFKTSGPDVLIKTQQVNDRYDPGIMMKFDLRTKDEMFVTNLVRTIKLVLMVILIPFFFFGNNWFISKEIA